mgnify:CR=1 FL=1
MRFLALIFQKIQVFMMLLLLQLQHLNKPKTFKVLVRFDADADIRYYKNGGILPMVVRKKMKGA